MTATLRAGTAGTRTTFPPNRAPQVTLEFWLIKLLAVTMGETAADFLAVNLGWGLTATSLTMTAFLVAAIALQFSRRQYTPWAYWLAVVMISIVGTLVTDNLVDTFGVPLGAVTAVCALALAATFAAWWISERSLSIHEIFTARREAFYWAAILFTFALGTAVGDLVAETYEFGYLATGLLFAASVATVAFAYYVIRINGVLAFWAAYVLTRPLGASFGDLLSQPAEYGGFGVGTVITSAIFLGCIVGLVIFLTATDRDGSGTTARTSVG